MKKNNLSQKDRKALEDYDAKFLLQQCRIIDLLCIKANENSLYFDLKDTLERVKKMRDNLEEILR